MWRIISRLFVWWLLRSFSSVAILLDGSSLDVGLFISPDVRFRESHIALSAVTFILGGSAAAVSVGDCTFATSVGGTSVTLLGGSLAASVGGTLVTSLGGSLANFAWLHVPF